MQSRIVFQTKTANDILGGATIPSNKVFIAEYFAFPRDKTTTARFKRSLGTGGSPVDIVHILVEFVVTGVIVACKKEN